MSELGEIDGEETADVPEKEVLGVVHVVLISEV